jgi:hypothetical protein
MSLPVKSLLTRKTHKHVIDHLHFSPFLSTAKTHISCIGALAVFKVEFKVGSARILLKLVNSVTSSSPIIYLSQL